MLGKGAFVPCQWPGMEGTHYICAVSYCPSSVLLRVTSGKRSHLWGGGAGWGSLVMRLEGVLRQVSLV